MIITYQTPNRWLINARPLPKATVESIIDFQIKFKIQLYDMLKVIESIFNHPNQLNLADFLRHCLGGKIRFVFLGDRAGVGMSNRARDVFSFDSLGDMIDYSTKVSNSKKSGRDFLQERYDDLWEKERKRRYKNNYSIRGKNGRFVSKKSGSSEQFATRPCIKHQFLLLRCLTRLVRE